MEITIGMQYVSRELNYEIDLSEEEIKQRISEAIADPQGVLTFTDTKGRNVIVPSRTLAYVTVGPDEPRRVGFGIG